MRFPQTVPASQVMPNIRPAAKSDAGAAIGQMAYVCLCLFAFITPWSETGLIVNGIAINRWFGLAALALVVVRTRFHNPPRGLADLHWWMVAFAGWSIASLFWTLDRDTTIERAGTYLQLLLFVWVVWELCTSESRIAGVLQSYVLGTSVIAVGTIANLLTGRAGGQLAGMEGLGADRYTIEGVNPNELGLMLALSIPMTFYLLAYRKGWQPIKLVLWVHLVLAATAILLSGSRGAVLAASAVLLMLPMTLLRLSRLQKALMVVAVAGIVIAAVSLVPPDTWQRLMNLGDEITEGTMTHRTQIWAASEVVFREHPLAGVGSGAHALAVTSLLGRPLVAHNTFFSALAELGVIGELLLLGILAAAFHSAWRMPRPERMFWISVLAAWCIGAGDGTLEYRKITWLLLSLLVAHAYVRRESVRVMGHEKMRSVCVASPTL